MLKNIDIAAGLSVLVVLLANIPTDLLVYLPKDAMLAAFALVAIARGVKSRIDAAKPGTLPSAEPEHDAAATANDGLPVVREPVFERDTDDDGDGE